MDVQAVNRQGEHHQRPVGSTVNEASSGNVVDREIQAQMELQKRQLESLFGTNEQDSNAFDSCRIARDVLQKCCEQLAEHTDSEKDIRFGLHRKSAKVKANEELRRFIGKGFDDVTTLIRGLEICWKQKHSKVYNRLMQVCNTLHSHKEVFSIFPNQSLYASVFCGALSMLVQAAVNHDTIADTLSRTLGQLSSRVSRCASLLHVIKTDSMKSKLADVYSMLFYFFRDMIQWYMKSSSTRFFESFNSNVNKRFEETAQAITERIDEMEKEAAMGGLAMQRASLQQMSSMQHTLGQQLANLQSGMTSLHAEIVHSRQPPFDPAKFASDVGEAMAQSLLRNFEEVTLRSHGIEYRFGELEERTISSVNRVQTVSEEACPHGLEAGSFDPHHPRNESMEYKSGKPGNSDIIPGKRIQTSPEPHHLYRLEVLDHLRNHIVGDDGRSALQNRQKWLVPWEMASKLRTWLAPDRLPSRRVIWLSGLMEPDHTSTSRAASLAVVAAAARIDVPLIAHFCRKPSRRDVEEDHDPDQLGLTGLVYNLMLQLLQLINSQKSENSQPALEVDAQVLDGSEQSWPYGLRLLDELLSTISSKLPVYIVLHGINNLESSSNGFDWCCELVSMLLQYQEDPRMMLTLLFTTAGQSRVLSKVIWRESQYRCTLSMKEVQRRGKALEFYLPVNVGSQSTD